MNILFGIFYGLIGFVAFIGSVTNIPEKVKEKTIPLVGIMLISYIMAMHRFIEMWPLFWITLGMSLMTAGGGLIIFIMLTTLPSSALDMSDVRED